MCYPHECARQAIVRLIMCSPSCHYCKSECPPSPVHNQCYRRAIIYSGSKDAQSLLQHVATITKKSDSDPKNIDPSALLSIGSGLTPIPNKLGLCIQAGEFIDMAELLPDCLGISTTPGKGDKQVTNKSAGRHILQCFSICFCPNPETPRP